MKLMINIIKKITYPGYRIHEFAVRAADSETAQAVITAICSLLAAVSILRTMWPFRSILHFVAACLLVVVATGILIAMVHLVYYFLMMFISVLFIPAATIYAGCANHQYKHKGDRAGGNLGSGPEADVGIRYFIEQEKGKELYRAVFLP